MIKYQIPKRVTSSFWKVLIKALYLLNGSTHTSFLQDVVFPTSVVLLDDSYCKVTSQGLFLCHKSYFPVFSIHHKKQCGLVQSGFARPGFYFQL